MPGQDPSSTRIRRRLSRAILDSEDDTDPSPSPIESEFEPESDLEPEPDLDPEPEPEHPKPVVIIGHEVSGQRINATTRAFYLTHANLPAIIRVSVPPRVSIDGIGIGVAVMDPMPPSTHGKPRILLVKRSSSKPFKPGRWQLPGAELNITPKRTMKQAVIGLLREDTGLAAREIVAEIQPNCYYKSVDGSDGLLITQFNFVVEVSDPNGALLNTARFSEGKWVTREDIQAQARPRDLDPDIRAVVVDAFEWAERRVQAATAAGREYERYSDGDSEGDEEYEDD